MHYLVIDNPYSGIDGTGLRFSAMRATNANSFSRLIFPIIADTPYYIFVVPNGH
jgi:hypothetical protein